MKRSSYDNGFYKDRDAKTAHFAARLSKIIVETFSPASAVDLGCGVGTVLRHLEQKGCAQLLGVEGPWLEPASLTIRKDQFQHADLTVPFKAERNFDIAISLEVAEHLDEKHAERFVESLCGLSSRIIFSAAIPQQGGMYHVNEQWQSYWAAKFLERGYRAFDIIRPLIWNDRLIATHYRQNCVVYLDGRAVLEKPSVVPFEVTQVELLDRVHPDLYLAHMASKHPMNISYKQLLAYFPKATWAAGARAAKRVIRDSSK